MIAVGSFFDGNLVSVGKVLNIASFLLCAALQYRLTKDLWNSRLAASIAVLWFSICRGPAPVSVEMVTPDLLLAAAVLLYFLVLLRCLRNGSNLWWAMLGAAHALAYLSKGFALPWLALCTVLSVVLSSPPRRWVSRIALSGAMPFLVAAAWAGVLHTKYGVLTTGTQFKANFLEWTVRAYDNQPDAKYSVLKDTKLYMDEYDVNDPMAPGAWPSRYPSTCPRRSQVW
jgi:4-amino-4-deoxy-L-arabinose transferase-like glycosyltransferase